jgi:response regulator RpfG family c-di-GMP phosphodiesterase
MDAKFPSASKRWSIRQNATLLMLGADTKLLEMRRRILEGHGFKVIALERAADAKKLMMQGPIDLFIFCYTLTNDECNEAQEAAKAIQPETKILSLEAGQWTCAEETADAVVSMLDGPGNLLNVVEQMTEDCATGEASG